MKDWKFLQVGNTKTGNYESSTQRPDSKIYQTIHEFIKTSGGDADKAFVAIKRKYPNLTDEFIEKSIDEVIRTNKAGNESIDKQEWSLYQGLKKDAEKEIGNAWTSADERRFDELNKKGPSKMTDAEWKEFQELNKRAYQADRKALKSIGNATGDEYNAEIQRLTKKAEQLRRMGQGKSAMEIEKQIEKLGKEMRELGNKKTGNEAPEEMEVKYKGYTITYFPYQKKYMVRHPKEVSGLVQKHFTSVDEAKKAIDKKAIGNEETKAERKFGKVMGEFEEGILKTPQGKTVTDPAQAKAIAYSEADKVDNLKRARNAMNKKVKNSSVREYKDSEGRIAQIDFNSDGTDADMSIYEDERMTRSVESKNFSTIRDAEQYVQSHGFRRVG